MGYTIFGVALVMAALLGQKEAQVILLLWIAWPILKLLPRAFNLRKKGATPSVVKAEVVDVQEAPRPTRPVLENPDTVDVAWKPVSTPRWKVFAAAVGLLGVLLFLGGALSLILTLLR